MAALTTRTGISGRTTSAECPALYVSKLATDVHLKGQELGNELLDWAGRYAASQGIRVLRLDTSKNSDGLRDYYVNRGWTYVRTENLPGRASGSLFERAVDLSLSEAAADDPPTGQFAVRTLGLTGPPV
ncbi:MAG: GntR family transcriptional regulator [Actinomycetota bacterium]|nr:GntR family transcriptional regulator [Actinomycetota bacterium]